MANRILIIEDDHDIANLIALHLHDLLFKTDTCHDGNDGYRCARNTTYDLIMLDLGLPGLDGIELCKRLRQAGDQTPILMLTAKSSELDRVLGLELGADDYLTKPFSIKELLARVKAILRRTKISPSADKSEANISIPGLNINPSCREVELDGKAIELTAREFDLLFHFASHPGRVFSRAQLLDLVWGYGHDGYEHTVNSHINRLRNKIEPDHTNCRFIHTVWGIGYKFQSGPVTPNSMN